MGIIARQGVKASIAGFIGVGIGAIFKLFVVTRFLSTSEIGLIETILKLGLIMMPLFLLGASPVVRRYFAKYKTESDDGGLIFASFLLMIAAMVVCGLSYFFLQDFIVSLYPEAPELGRYMHLPLFGVVVYALFLFLSAVSTVHFRVVVPKVLFGIVNRVGVFAVVLLYGYFGLLNIDQMMNGYMLAFYLVPLLGLILYVRFIIKPRILYNLSNGLWLDIYKSTSKYNAFLLLSATSAFVIQAIDIQMISGSLGTSYAGVYSIAFYMGAIIEVPRRNINNISFPVIAEALNVGNMSKIKSIYKKTSLNQLVVGTILFAGVWINIDAIFAIIPNGETFAAGKYVVLFIALGKLFDMATGINKQIIEASNYYKYNLLINVILSGLVIGFNLLFIPSSHPLFGGINGAAFASLLAMVISNSVAIAVVWLKFRMHPFQKAMLIPALAMAVLLLMANFKFNFDSPYLNILLNGSLIVILLYGTYYLTGVSKDFDEILKNLLQKLRK